MPETPTNRSAFEFVARAAVALLAMAGSLLVPSPAAAQETFQIQVQGSQTVGPGSTTVESFSSIAPRGTTRTEDGVVPSQGAFHETVQITQGWTSWLETGVSVLTSVQPDGGWEWAGVRVQPRVRAPASWHLPVGLGLSAQVGYERRAFSTDTWTLTLGPVIDRQWGPWYISLNPNLGCALEGENASRGFEFVPSVKIGRAVTARISAGIEYYAGLGPVTGFDRFKQQAHQIFPVIDLNLGPRWEFNAGVGVGLTPATDRLVVKMILGYRFDWTGAGR